MLLGATWKVNHGEEVAVYCFLSTAAGSADDGSGGLQCALPVQEIPLQKEAETGMVHEYGMLVSLTRWPLGNAAVMLKLLIFTLIWYQTSKIDPEHFLWNCSQVNATRPHWWLVNIGSGGNGFLLPGNEPLLEVMSTKIYNTIWCHQATMIYKKIQKLNNVSIDFQNFHCCEIWKVCQKILKDNLK